MEKQFKTALILMVIFSFITILFNVFWTNNKLSHALNMIDTVQNNLDKVLIDLNYSKQKIDTMKSDLNKYKIFIYEIKGRAEIIDLEKRKNDFRFNSERKTITQKLDSLYKILGVKEISIEIEPLDK